MGLLQENLAEFPYVYWSAIAIVVVVVGWKVLHYGMRPKNMPPGK
jgi:hypothetical protein